MGLAFIFCGSCVDYLHKTLIVISQASLRNSSGFLIKFLKKFYLGLHWVFTAMCGLSAKQGPLLVVVFELLIAVTFLAEY